MLQKLSLFFVIIICISLNAFPSSLGRKSCGLSSVHCSPGDTFGKLVYGKQDLSTGGLMRLSLIGIGAGLLAGAQSVKASDTQLCNTLSVDEIVKEATLTSLDSNVVTKPNDERHYKALTLSNQLRVLLVSDSSASRSAAAVDVHVGSFSDPENVPGLAHFAEHMSYLGTKKFPTEEGFSSFLASHGGSSNAYTDNEDTVYYFDVNAEYLSEALDRFSQFFIAPLFTASATNRELNAIDSEHAKNINSDLFRLYQLEKNGANPAHPFHKFATGNKATLETNAIASGIDVRQQLLEFHADHYSANQMTLCIIGKESIGDLEQWARQYFSDVPNKNAPTPADEWRGLIDVYLPQKSATLLEVVPVAESRRLTMMWPISLPSRSAKAAALALKPESVISHLLGHEGKGSVRSLLAAKGWANAVQVAPSADISDCQLFEVNVDLTEAGLQHRNEVADIIFSFIDLISTKDSTISPTGTIPAYIFQEVEALSRISFNFSEKAEPADFASSVVADMQNFHQPSKYLTGTRLFNYYPITSQCEVARYLSYLTPQNLHMSVISKDFEGKTRKEAEWYGTKYNEVKTLESETKRWGKVTKDLFPSLALPAPNALIPENFELLAPIVKKPSQTEKDQELARAPTLLREDGRWTVWHKLDKSYQQPRIYAVVSLAVPSTKYDATFVMTSRLFTSCFMDSINEFIYDARLAGLGFNIEFTSKGVQLLFEGFSDKIGPYVEKVMRALTEFKPDAKAFMRYLDQQKRSLAGWKTQQPYYHSAYYASLATETLQFPVASLEAALSRLDISCLDHFLSSILNESAGQALVMGNIDEHGAEQLVGIIEHAFPFTTLAPALRSRRYVSIMPPATAEIPGYKLAHPEPNEQDDNCAATFYFQLPSRRPEDTVPLELLADAIEQGFYNTLRTQQQLGYIVYSGIRSREGVYSLTLTVQSNILSGEGLSRRIEDYLDTAITELTNLSAADFEAFKEGIRVRKLEPDQRLSTHASRFWSEISMSPVEEPLFDRYVREVNVLNKIKQSEFNTFVRDFLGRGGTKRRLLVSEITTQRPLPAATEVDDKNPKAVARPPLKLISDEIAFQKEQQIM